MAEVRATSRPTPAAALRLSASLTAQNWRWGLVWPQDLRELSQKTKKFDELSIRRDVKRRARDVDEIDAIKFSDKRRKN